ncbi:MAG: hypothetical protein IKK20_01685 [Clostridia bacterium]|nr:hypothetical protein [Clostridia bacterium]
MLAISISAVLLCLVGVWAAVQMNLNFHGKVSPDIYCKINAQYLQTIDGNSSSINKEIFNNNNGAQVGMPTTSGNTLKDLNIQLSGDVTTAVTFQLTNYTPNKYIRLSVADISGATIKSGDVAVCPPASQSTTPQTMTIFVAGDSQATTATISLKVEEVYQVKVAGTGLALDATDSDETYDYYYFAPGDNCEITLEPMVGYQLPTTIIIPTVTVPDEEAENATKEVSIATYSRDSNTCGTVSLLNKYLKNSTISANCNQIFAIKQSNGVSMLNNQATTIENPVYIDVYKKTIKINESQTTASELEIRFNDTNTPTEGYKKETIEGTTLEFEKTLDPINSGQYFEETIQDTTYLPNNGHYYRAKDGQTTYIVLEAGFIEYPYYVEMGMYPQTKATPAGAPTDNLDNGQTFTDGDGITYEYVVNTDAEKTGWYKYEPIKWIVLGTQDSTYSLSELKFQNGMLYTDGACGKPYTGQLLLMSAYVLESSTYNESQSSTQKFSTSRVASWLKDTFSQFSTGINGITMGNAASAGQYLKKQSLDSLAVTSNYINSAMSNTFNNDNMQTAFFLLGGVGKATLINDENDKENGSISVDEHYYAGTYFNVGGIYEGTGQSTFNVGVTSPTAYAIATGVERSSFSGITQSQSFSATATRGWGGFGDSTAISTCAYWTRSGGESFGAYVISMQGKPVNILATNDNVGVRPMVVLDMGFYETGIYTETNNAQSQSET